MHICTAMRPCPQNHPSADPSSTSFTWDERVRTWASKLGVCAQPSPSTPKHATPLPTPPSRDSEEQQQQQHWPASANGCCTGPLPSSDAPATGTAVADPSRKPSGSAKRVGSFARGFLLGIGGAGGSGPATAAAAASDSPSEDAPVPAAALEASATETETEGESAASSASTLPGTSDSETAAVVVGGCHVPGEGDACIAAAADAASSGALFGAAAACGRGRWVKGAPPSSSDSGSDSDHDNMNRGNSMNNNNGNYSIHNNTGGGSTGESATPGDNRGKKKDQIDSFNGDTLTGNGRSSFGARTPAVEDGDDEKTMAWLETGAGIGGANGGGGGGGGTAKTASKKKKKGKAKGKGSKPKKSATAKSSAAPELPSHPSPAEADDASETVAKPTRSRCKQEQGQQHKQPQRKSLNVTFGYVSLLEFTRDVGGCAVPGDGTWGLALGLPFRESVVEVDGYEASKAEVGHRDVWL